MSYKVVQGDCRHNKCILQIIGTCTVLLHVHLALCLQVICSRESQFDSESLVETLHESSGKGHPAIGSMYERDSVKLPNVLDVELHQIGCGDIGGYQDEMCHFHETISDHVYHVEST